MNAPPANHVELVPYDSQWPAEFRAIAAHLRSVLGPLALRIDHIGSTAVEGLASKNVIDLQVTVSSVEEPHRQRLVALLSDAGYQLGRAATDHRPPGAAGPDSDWHKLFAHNPPASRRSNIHLRAIGRPNQLYPILFRDFLRAHPRSAEAYSRLKHLIAPLVPAPVYPDLKDPACDLIYEHARTWAAQIRWQPPPSDA